MYLKAQHYVPARTLRSSSNFKLSVYRESGTFQDSTSNVFNKRRHNIKICKGNCEFNRNTKVHFMKLQTG